MLLTHALNTIPPRHQAGNPLETLVIRSAAFPAKQTLALPTRCFEMFKLLVVESRRTEKPATPDMRALVQPWAAQRTALLLETPTTDLP